MRRSMRLLMLLPLCILATAGQANDVVAPEQTAVLERTVHPLGVIKFAQKPPMRDASPVPLPIPVDPESAAFTFPAALASRPYGVYPRPWCEDDATTDPNRGPENHSRRHGRLVVCRLARAVLSRKGAW